MCQCDWPAERLTPETPLTIHKLPYVVDCTTYVAHLLRPYERATSLCGLTTGWIVWRVKDAPNNDVKMCSICQELLPEPARKMPLPGSQLVF